MSRPPSHEDAQLILRLYDLRREPRLRKARDWMARTFIAETYDELQRVAPVGSEEHGSFRMVMGYWEMASSFRMWRVSGVSAQWRLRKSDSANSSSKETYRQPRANSTSSLRLREW